MAEATAQKQGLMEKVQVWVEQHVVPPINKITSNFWFSLVADAVLVIVPFTMVAAIPSLVAVIGNFVEGVPDLSPISTYSFGLIGLFIAFLIPYNCMVKDEKKEHGVLAGFTGIGTYMLCMAAETLESGETAFTMGRFGAGGMFTAIFLGLMCAAIFHQTAKRSFFSEDSLIPDFVKNWFDNIIGILSCLLIGWLVAYVASIDIFSLVTYVMSPLTGFAQTLPGVIFMTVVMDFFYFFGVSGWVFTPVTSTITSSAIAENAAAVAAGGVATNINAYGFSRYTMIGGEGSTLPLAIMMLFSKSKKNKAMGQATIVPSLFNINEPLFFSTVVANPYMFMPMMLQAVVCPTVAWLMIHFGLASTHYVMFAMNNLPNAVSAFVLSGGNLGNVMIVLVNIVLATLVWFPFWRAYDKHQCEVEAEMEAQMSRSADTSGATPAMG